MDKLLDDLFAKRGSVREEALSSIIDGFKLNCRHQFATKNFATLLYRCLNSFKKGSSKEIVLASRALGLLAITVGCGENAQELYRESLPFISQALKSRTESVLLSVIEYFAIATFVGADSFEHTEDSMKMIWHFIRSNPGEAASVMKISSSVLSAAIVAWSLCLTTVNGWNLSHTNWKGAISYFLDLLKVDYRPVSIAAGEAIALILEVGSLEKFVDTTIDNIISDKEKNIADSSFSTQESREIISNHAATLLREATLQSADTKTMNGLNVLAALEGGSFHQTSFKVGKHNLQLNSLCQLSQVNFVKRFLGPGFVPHMLENEFLHDVFGFTRRKQSSGGKLYSAEREEVVIRFFAPESKQRDGEDDFLPFKGKTQSKSRSALDKAKTRLLNMHRDLRGEELWPFQD